MKKFVYPLQALAALGICTGMAWMVFLLASLNTAPPTAMDLTARVTQDMSFGNMNSTAVALAREMLVGMVPTDTGPIVLPVTGRGTPTPVIFMTLRAVVTPQVSSTPFSLFAFLFQPTATPKEKPDRPAPTSTSTTAPTATSRPPTSTPTLTASPRPPTSTASFTPTPSPRPTTATPVPPSPTPTRTATRMPTEPPPTDEPTNTPTDTPTERPHPTHPTWSSTPIVPTEPPPTPTPVPPTSEPPSTATSAPVEATTEPAPQPTTPTG